MLSFWPFCSGVLPSPTPSLSLRARLQLPKGSCHPPPFPTASCCPQKQQWSLWCLAGDFRELGMDSFPWEPSPTIGQRDRCCVRPCHPLPLPIPALGTSTAAAGSGGACQGGSVLVGQLPPPPQAVSKWLHFGGERWPHGVEARWWECAKPPAASMSAVGRFSAAPGPAWLLHTHEVPVWHVEEQRLGPACGRLWQPCWEASPTHPSLKNTLCAAESSSPRQGVEPSSATLQSGGGAGTGAMPLGNGLPWSWQGYFWSRWSRSRGRSGAGHRHRCLAPRHGLSLSSFFMSFPGKAPGMKSNPSA